MARLSRNDTKGGRQYTKGLRCGIARSDLELVQEVYDLRLAPFHGANELAADNAIAINDVGLGPLETAVNGTGFLVGIAHGREVYLIVFQELMIGIAINIDADPNDSYTFILKALL